MAAIRAARVVGVVGRQTPVASSYPSSMDHPSVAGARKEGVVVTGMADLASSVPSPE
jgi:hypothetical protein